MDLKLNEELVFTNLSFSHKEEALTFLSEQLLEKAYVKEDYPHAILEREKEYPTGLPSQGAGIAIPHANNDLVNETMIAIGVLTDPVVFQSMENPEQDLNISIIVMLAIKEPHGQIEMLQRVVSIIQNAELTRQIADSNDKNEVVSLIKPYLYEEQMN
ncbi:PTS sugar transporter subunit IIA [Atopococcus tabaci]|uniref:PTS sugar transporter subunit IIA n=1 Tax=Atopococcus tabaci TaxID=269774 RepID=UPI0003F95FE6|nr:PTS sugar transporter subunit IIA [Atopococcus tabaci]